MLESDARAQPPQALDDLAAIFAKGVLRHIRMEQASALDESQSVNSASKNELLVASAHGSVSHELTDTETGKEEVKCQ